MNSGKSIFNQLVDFLPKRTFDGIVKKRGGDSLREVICIILHGKFYAFDSTTIDLCLSLFQWASFRKTKGGIKVHTLFDVVTQIPTYIHITEVKLHDVNAMDDIPYERMGHFDFIFTNPPKSFIPCMSS